MDERTALENQVLGSYAQLDQEVMLLASVRGIDPQGQLIKKPPLPLGRKEVVRAMQRAAFNRDDLEQYKQGGIIGENNQGGVTILALDKVEPPQHDFIKSLVAEENADRNIIMRRIINTDESLSLNDLPRIQAIFSAMNRDKAQAGAFIQTKEGSWQRKDGETSP